MSMTTRNDSGSIRETREQAGSDLESDDDTLEILKGATELAQKAGFRGRSLTPFVYEYLHKKKESASGSR